MATRNAHCAPCTWKMGVAMNTYIQEQGTCRYRERGGPSLEFQYLEAAPHYGVIAYIHTSTPSISLPSCHEDLHTRLTVISGWESGRIKQWVAISLGRRMDTRDRLRLRVCPRFSPMPQSGRTTVLSIIPANHYVSLWCRSNAADVSSSQCLGSRDTPKEGKHSRSGAKYIMNHRTATGPIGCECRRIVADARR